MIKDVLQSIAFIEIYPIISMVLFLMAFMMVMIYMFRLDKADIKRYSRFPLNDPEKMKSVTIPIRDEEENSGV